MQEHILNLYALVVPDVYPNSLRREVRRVPEQATEAGEESAGACLRNLNCGDEAFARVVFAKARPYAMPGILAFEGRVVVKTPEQLLDPQYAEVLRRLVRGMVLTCVGSANALHVGGTRLVLPSADLFLADDTVPLLPPVESLLTGPLLPV